MITLTWSPPLSPPAPTNYVVFYELSDEPKKREIVRANEGNSFTVQVDLMQNFTAFVVAYIDSTPSLPSVRSNSTELLQGKCIPCPL